SPSSVSGTLITMLSANFASSRPSAYIRSLSTATTSALMGPGTSSQISFRMSRGLAPLPAAFDRSDGFVVMPSIRPASIARRISLTSALSRKNFIFRLALQFAACVDDAAQKKTFRRRRDARLDAGFVRKQPVDVVRRTTPQPHIHHRTHHVANHVVQEPVRRHVQLPAERTPLSPCDAVHRAHLATFGLAGLRKCAERVFAREPCRRCLQCSRRQCTAKRPAPAPEKGR